MKEIENLKQAILKEYPRLSENDRFCFRCGPDMECFNRCCTDVNIFLTPYDVLRMRRESGMGSQEFLNKYTIIPFDKSLKLPIPQLEMVGDKTACPFVDFEKGCTIYANRPTPCRMYPIGFASPGESAGELDVPFYFVMHEDVCMGHDQSTEWTIMEWISDQGSEPFLEFGELFKQITLHKAFASDHQLAAKQVDIYWMSLYDLDRFRRFIFKSTFRKRFDVDEHDYNEMEKDDEALLRFGFKWVRMALFGEKTIHIKPEVEREFLSGEKKPETG